MGKKILVDSEKYSKAYHALQKCLAEMKKLLDFMMSTSAEMLQCIEDQDAKDNS